MPTEDHRWRRARAEWAAARACLRDRRAGVPSASEHVGRAFAALLATGGAMPDAEAMTAAARAGVDAPWGESIRARAGDLAQLLGRAPGDRRLARRLSRELGALVGGRPVRHRLRLGLALVVALVAGAAVAFALLGRGGDAGDIGFRGRYYPRPSFGGEPEVRLDPGIDFSWLGHAPIGGLPADLFSVRWDGCFDLEAEARLGLRVGSDDGSRVLLDGKQVIDNWRDQGGNWVDRTLSVQPGRHHLRVEYYERGGDAFVVFELTRDGSPVERGFIRPPTVLEPEVSCEPP